MLFKISRLPARYQFIRALSSKKDVREKEAAILNKKFIPIYKFPYIRVFSVVNRLKLYQTVLTVVTVPVSITLNQINVLSQDMVFATILLGLSGTMILYTLGILSTRLIGFVYLSEDKSMVKVSSVDFWGRRRDETVAVNDIVPFSDLPSTMTDGLYLRLVRFSKSGHLKINLRYGIVLDKNDFNKVFK